MPKNKALSLLKRIVLHGMAGGFPLPGSLQNPASTHQIMVLTHSGGGGGGGGLGLNDVKDKKTDDGRGASLG